MLKKSQSLQGDLSDTLLQFAQLLQISESKAKNIVFTGKIRKHSKAGNIKQALEGCMMLLKKEKKEKNKLNPNNSTSIHSSIHSSIGSSNGSSNGHSSNGTNDEVYVLCSDVIGQILEQQKQNQDTSDLHNQYNMFGQQQHLKNTKNTRNEIQNMIQLIIADGLTHGPIKTLPSFVIHNQSPWTILPPTKATQHNQHNQHNQDSQHSQHSQHKQNVQDVQDDENIQEEKENIQGWVDERIGK